MIIEDMMLLTGGWMKESVTVIKIQNFLLFLTDEFKMMYKYNKIGIAIFGNFNVEILQS